MGGIIKRVSEKGIWDGDLLDRQREARALEQFLTVKYQELGRNDSYSIAIDAGFGEGKSWFLRRLSRSLEQNHPVAFIDAWEDDTADQPLTALMVAIEEALDPYIGKPTSMAGKTWARVKKEKWKLAKIAALGGAKRVAALAITQQGVSAMESALGEKAAEDAAKDSAKAAEEMIDQLADVFARKEADAFKERRASVKKFKDSLKMVIGLLAQTEVRGYPPVFIIIDELDRCRPTYAVKMLEEVKHLFSVPGLFFIYGMHAEALNHSIKALYGSEFPADHYLRRFIQRRYQLMEPSMAQLIQLKLAHASIPSTHLIAPRLDLNQVDPMVDLALLIDKMMRANAMRARDVDPVMDIFVHFCRLWSHEGPVHVVPLLFEVIALAGNVPLPVIPPLDVYLNSSTPEQLSNLNGQYITLGVRLIDQVNLSPHSGGTESWLYNHIVQQRNTTPLAERGIAKPSWSDYARRVRMLGNFKLKLLDPSSEELASDE